MNRSSSVQRLNRPETQEGFYPDNFFKNYKAMIRWFGSHESSLDRDIY